MNIVNPKMKLYFDTSALVKEFVNETGSAEVKQYVVEKVHQEDVVFSTAVITKAEIAAALSAMRRNRELTQPKLDEAVSRFELLSKVVFELKSSGNPDFRNHFDSIRELYTFNHLCQVIKATQLSPILFCTLSQLKHHVQHPFTIETAL